MNNDFFKICKHFSIILSIVVNVFSSVSIIQINKYIYINYRFPNMALTCLHFIFTFFGLLAYFKLRNLQVKHVSILKMLPMALSFCGFVVLTNYSLQFNSIGSYQCFKSLSTPFVIIISYYFYNKKYSRRIIFSIALVLLGIYINSMFDLSFNFVGTILGICAALITALYLIWIGEKQKEFNLNSLQLLLYQAPLSAVILIFLTLIFEPIYDGDEIIYFTLASKQWLMLFVSAGVAFLVNISVFWIIGISSALTYNMASYSKFVLVIMFGVILFDDLVNIQQFFAFAIVLTALIMYSVFSIQENSKKSEEVKSKSTEENITIIVDKLKESAADSSDV